MDAASLPSDSVPVLSRTADFAALKLGATEGYILSRIDGATSVKGICALSTVSEAQTREVLVALAQQGILELRDKSGQALRVESNSEESALDPAIRMRVQQILRAAELGNPYAILNVANFSDIKAIKQSYYAMTQEFHPDNFYGREIGSWSQKIDQAFTAVTGAYEELSDADTKSQADRRLRILDQEDSSAPPPPGAAAPPKVDRKQSAAFLAAKEKVIKAREMAGMAEMQMHKGDFGGAYNSYLLAAGYDPYNEDYKRNVQMLSSKVARKRAEDLLRRARQKLDQHDEDGAQDLLRQAVETDKNQTAAKFELARIYFGKLSRLDPGTQDEARQLAESAATLDGEKIEYLMLAGHITRALKRPESAREWYEAALKLDRKNEVAKKALKDLQ